LGQRQGIGLGGRGPFFVVAKNLIDNTLIVTDNQNDPTLFRREVALDKVNWLSGAPQVSFECLARFRHLQKLFKISAKIESENQARVIFNKPERAVAPGQALVFYEKIGWLRPNYRMIGGGIISS
jgi:tRNA-specific 2-thiouridylase